MVKSPWETLPELEIESLGVSEEDERIARAHIDNVVNDTPCDVRTKRLKIEI